MSAPKTMSEAVAAYNEMATAKGKETVTSFKNLAAARAAMLAIEADGAVPAADGAVPAADGEKVIPGLDTPSNSGNKYNSSAKRGPTQGIGAFCKGLITAGKTNAEILAEVATQFPTAKTTANCVAYYRAKMAKAAVAPVAETEAPAVDASAVETPATEETATA